MMELTQWPEIILVNGTSSAGKSTLCLAMQNAFPHPYLYFSFDTLVFLMPKRYYSNADTASQTQFTDYTKEGVQMIQNQKPGEPLCTVAQFGPVFRHMIDAIPGVIAAIVEKGTSVIFDQVYHDQQMYDDCMRCFKNYNVLEVGVYCPIEILDEREKQRGDRVLGRARGLYDIVHSFSNYDVTVDTSKLSVEECIAKIKKFII